MHTVQISSGELLDRLSILDIKSRVLADSPQISWVVKEKEPLARQALALLEDIEVRALYERLVAVNEAIWNAMQTIYDWNGARDSTYVEAVLCIIDENKARAAVKRQVDDLLSSPLREAKSFFT